MIDIYNMIYIFIYIYIYINVSFIYSFLYNLYIYIYILKEVTTGADLINGGKRKMSTVKRFKAFPLINPLLIQSTRTAFLKYLKSIMI